ncbi:MAG TPA: Rieske 2Fe-2S domain-containing protein [Symbiobacteriaceae bacterium]|nr:Rieske 2Fe-2S domain-containing protein [Symbiobacteriaceae bacterium]
MAEEKKAPAGAAAPPAAPAADGLTRRQALRSGMFATIGAMFATVTGGSAAMFWPIKLTGFGGVVAVPKELDEIKMGEVVTVREGKFYLTRTEEGLMALYWKCVHLGCTVPWNAAQGKFMCPCHGSVYTLSGQNVAGPAPRPLDAMEIKVSGQEITVNTGKIKQRPVHSPSDAVKV